MASTSDKVSLTIAGLTLAALGIISPIAWDWWNKKSQLTVEVPSIISMTSNKTYVRKLDFTYDGRRVESLHQVVVKVVNSGRTPLTREDVVSPLQLKFGPGEILEAKIVERRPSNLNLDLSINQSDIAVLFDLLNPGESADIAILTTSRDPVVSAAARIRGVSSIMVIRNVQSSGSNTDTKVALISVGFLGFIFLGLTIVSFGEGRKKSGARAKLGNGSHPILVSASLDAAMKLANQEFSFISGERKSNFLHELQRLSWPLGEDERRAAGVSLSDAIKKEPTWVVFFLLGLPVSSLAIYFVTNRLLAILST